MTGRRVSREPYKARRDRKELIVAIGVAMLIVVATVVGVWILAPDGSPPSIDAPAITPGSPAPSSATTTAPPTTDPAPDPSSTTVPSPGG